MNDNYIIPVILFMTVVIAIGLYIIMDKDKESDFISPYTTISTISESDVLKIKANQTYKEIIGKLGKTKDIGRGVHVAQYIVDESYLYLSFMDLTDECKLSGEQLLNTLQPINEEVGITGTVKNIDKANDVTVILVESSNSNHIDKASVIINKDTKIYKEDNKVLLKPSDIKLDSVVIVVFKGPIAESYPVQGTALTITIKKGLDEDIVSLKEGGN